MLFQIPADAVRLLSTGDTILYGNRPDNVVPAEVLGTGHVEDSVRVRLLENYDTNRASGNSYHAAGADVTALADRLWR